MAAFLSDMRTAGVTPDEETYRCAVRCATDAAMADAATEAAEAVGVGSSWEGVGEALPQGRSAKESEEPLAIDVDL